MRRVFVGALAVELVLVGSFAFAEVPYPVPVHGLKAASVPNDSVGSGVVVRIEEQPRGGSVVFVLGQGAMLFFYAHLDAAATAFAPVDPQLVIGPRPVPVTVRLRALVTSLPERR